MDHLDPHRCALVWAGGFFKGDNHLAEDAVQDAESELGRKHDETMTKLPIGVWLYRVKCRCIDILRRRKQLDLPGSDVFNSLVEAAPNTEEAPDERAASSSHSERRCEAVKQVLSTFDEETQALLTMAYTDGLLQSEIARRTHSTVGAIHSKLARIRKTLRPKLQRLLLNL